MMNIKSLHLFLIENYNNVIFIAFSLIGFTAFIHIPMHSDNPKLINFISSTAQLCQNMNNTIIIFFIIILCIIFFSIMYTCNQLYTKRCDTYHRLDIQKKYADYLFMQLVAKVNKIKQKKMLSKCLITATQLLRAQEEIQNEIDKFKSGTRKLLSPHPDFYFITPEEYYAMDYYEDDEDCQKYKHLHITLEEIKQMVNP